MPKYDSPFDLETRLAPVVVVADLGNNFLKVALLRYEESGHSEAGIFTHEILMEHAFVNLSPREWKSEVENSDGNLTRGKDKLTHAFKIKVGKDWKAVKVGNGVSDHRNNNPLLGSQKYVAGGIDALLSAVLCELLPETQYPNGHDNIILSIGHPPTEFHQVRNMVKLLQTKSGHQIEMPSGVKRKFVIRATIPFDESVGGLMHMQHQLNERGQLRDANGQFIKNPLQAGHRILMGDFGGRLGSMGWIVYEGGNNFKVQYDSFKPIEGGMITVRNSIRENLSAEFSNELQGVDFALMRDEWIDRILKTRQMVIKGNHGEPIDVSDIVERSLTYLNTIRSTYRDDFGLGITADHAMLTGGTVRDLYEEIKGELDHYSILPVANLEQINRANMLGGRHIALDTLRVNNRLPRQFQGFI